MVPQHDNLRTEVEERLRFETLLSDLSARFVNVPADRVDAEILDGQRRICECLGLDASALWQNESESSSVYVLTHLFRPPGGPAAPDRMDAEQYFPWCLKLLVEGSLVIVSSLDKLPPEAARDVDSWRYFGAKTSLTVPLSAGGGKVFGFLSFNDLQTEREWPEALVNRLKLVAQIFANALARRHSDEALRENAERFRGLAESSLVGIYVLQEGRYNYVNPAMARIFGYSVEEMIGMFPHDIVQSSDHATVAENIRRRINGDLRAMHYQVRGRHKDGSTREVEVYGTTVATKRGRCLVGTLIDITERKRSEEALKQSEVRFRQVAETVADFLWEVDANGLYTYASPSVEKILGYTSEYLVGKKHFYDLFVPEVREELKTAAFRVFASKQSFRSFPNPNVAKDGRIVDLETSGLPVLNDAGELIGYRGADTDVTERTRAELKLRESEELNRTTFEQAAVGIAHVGTDGLCLRVNDRLCSLLGYQKEELLQLTFQDITYPEDLDTDLEYMRRLLSGEIKTCSFEKRYFRKDKSIVWADLTVSLVRTAAGQPKYFISVLEDINARKQAEEALRNLSGRLITAQERERAWIAKELHDGISQHLALLSIELDALQQNPPKRTDVGRLKKLHLRANEMLDDVRRLSHGLHPSILDHLGLASALNSYCRDIEKVGDLSILFTAHNVPRELPRDVALCLYRVAQEALQNVLKHSGANRVTVELFIHASELRMRIADNGKGFDLNGEPAADSLGLVGMRERIGLVQGKMKLDTKPGKGTVVEVCVPMQPYASSLAQR